MNDNTQDKEIPHKFYDFLTKEIYKDPVFLGIDFICDRKNISKYREMFHNQNPYNKKEFYVNPVPCTELKNEIEDFLSGNINITVYDLQNKVYNIVIKPTMTLGILKKIIEERINRSISGNRLVNNYGKNLTDDDKTLKFLKIENNSTLRLLNITYGG